MVQILINQDNNQRMMKNGETIPLRIQGLCCTSHLRLAGGLFGHTEWFSISHCSPLSLLYWLKAWRAASIALPWKLANTLCYFNKHTGLAQCVAAGSLDLPVSADLLPTLSQSSVLLPLQDQNVKIPSLLPLPTTHFPHCCQIPFAPGLGASWWIQPGTKP